MKKISLATIAVLAFLPIVAYAATPSSMEIVDGALKIATTTAVAKLQTTAIIWLSLFVGLQFVITNILLLKSGADIEAIWGKLLGSVLWFGFCFYVMSNGTDFIDKVSQQFFTTAGDVAGTGVFSAGYVLDWGVNLAAGLLDAVDKAKGGGILAKLDFLPSIFAGITCLVILAAAAVIGFKLFLIKIEVALVIMLSPLSFAFLGLDALKDQGIAPFKALISLAYRILLLGVIVSAMGTVGDSLFAVFASVDSGSITAIWKPIFAALFAYFLLGYLAYKSDSIASNLASGGTSMGTGDVASAAAMGAAAGAAVATGGAVAAGAATKGGQSMGDFMKSLTGGSGGSVSNASGSGSGGQAPVGTAPVKPADAPALSVADNNAMRMAAGPELTGGSPAAEMTPNQSMAAQSAAGQAPSNAQAITDSLNSIPGSSSGSESPGPAVPPSGSGSSAGIGGASGAMDQKIDKLIDSLSKPAQKPSFGDRMSALNDHVAKEQTATHVSINTNSPG